MGGGDLALAAQCRAQYSSVNHTFANLDCQAPLGDGSISLDGTLVSPFGARAFDLVLSAQQVPAQSLVMFARHAKKDIPDDLLANGSVDAKLQLRSEVKTKLKGNTAALWQGIGEANGLHLASRFTNTDLTVERIPITLSADSTESSARLRSGLSTRLKVKAAVPAHEPHLGIGPFSVALGKAAPALMYGWISRSGYGFAIQGEAQLQRLLQAARTVGLAAPQPVADGVAKLDLQIAGAWAGFTAPRALGTAQLHSVRAQVRGWNVPLEIASANLLLSQEQVQVRNLAASVAGSEWRGSLVLPRPCLAPALCAVHFDLHADEIAADRLNLALNPGVRKQPWYHFLSSSAASGTPYLLAVRAAGKINADRVLIRKLTATHVSADARLEDGLLQLSNLRGDVLGGKHVGEWKADFTRKPPQYSGSGTLDRVALGQLSQVMNDGWITGTATGGYRVTTSGLSMAELLSSAAGSLQVEAHDGLLPHIALADGSGPLQMNRLALHLALAHGKFSIEEGNLETPAGAYQVNGSASLDRSLNVKLAREGSQGFDITGTLSKPLVSPGTNAETQASLKP